MSQPTNSTILKTTAQQSQSTQGNSLIRTSTTRLFRMNSQKSGNSRSEDASTRPLSTVEPRMTRSNSTSSSQQPTRFKSKRSKGTRGAITLLKSIGSATLKDVSVDEPSIEYDWGVEQLADLFARDVVELQTDNPGFNAEAYTMEEWINDVLTSYPTRQWEMSGKEVLDWMNKVEAVRRRFVYKPPMVSNGSLISPHPISGLPNPLSYDKVALQNDRHAYELLKRIYYDLPSIHGLHFTVEAPKVVLDLGCGDGSWMLDAARCWNGARFYGIDAQRVHPTGEEIAEEYGTEVAKRVKFVTFNFLSDKLPFVDGAFEMVRMANLKWCIPVNRWEDVLREVRRVTARGGLIEIIDDDFVAYTAPDNTLIDKESDSCHALEFYFTEVLHARKLALDTNVLMIENLGKVFTRFHGDIFPVAISPETSVVSPRAFQKTKGKYSNSVRSEIAGKRPSGESKLLERTWSGSDSSEATLYSHGSGNNVSCFDVKPEKPLESADSHPVALRPQPLGLVVLDRFIPCTFDEISAYATKNMQAVLSSREAIREHVLGKSPALTPWDPRTSETTAREDAKMVRDWMNAESEFEDLCWTYESAMTGRLNAGLGQISLEVSDSGDDDEELTHEPELPRPISSIGQIHKGDISWNSGVDQIATVLSAKGLSKLVRVIRVYTMWK